MRSRSHAANAQYLTIMSDDDAPPVPERLDESEIPTRPSIPSKPQLPSKPSLPRKPGSSARVAPMLPNKPSAANVTRRAQEFDMFKDATS